MKQINETLARVVAGVLLRQDPEKARKWIDSMKAKERKK